MVIDTIGRHKEREKGKALDEILRTRMVDGGKASMIVDFWKAVSRRADREVDTHRQAKKLVDKLRKDLEGLKELRATLRMRREDKMSAEQEPAVSQLIKMLDLILETLGKRWWLLKRKALARFIAWNPTFPARHLKLDDQKAAKKEKPGLEKVEARKKTEGEENEDEEEYDGY